MRLARCYYSGVWILRCQILLKDDFAGIQLADRLWFHFDVEVLSDLHAVLRDPLREAIADAGKLAGVAQIRLGIAALVFVMRYQRAYEAIPRVAVVNGLTGRIKVHAERVAYAIDANPLIERHRVNVLSED